MAACAPEYGAPEPPPEPAKPTAKRADKTAEKTSAKTSAQSHHSPIAVVSLLVGRRREPRHWLIAAHGDPAGLAARLQGTLAEYAAATSTSPFSNTATSATAQSTPNAAPNTTASAPARAELRASSNPATGARPQAMVQARSTASSQARSRAGANPRAESGPKQLLQRAFSDCTTLDRPDPPSGASYRYRLNLPSGRLASASLACWRRYSPGGAWQRRCGPMGLGPFLDHHGNPSNHLQLIHLY